LPLVVVEPLDDVRDPHAAHVPWNGQEQQSEHGPSGYGQDEAPHMAQAFIIVVVGQKGILGKFHQGAKGDDDSGSQHAAEHPQQAEFGNGVGA
jgi:hypothetical protein